MIRFSKSFSGFEIIEDVEVGYISIGRGFSIANKNNRLNYEVL